MGCGYFLRNEQYAKTPEPVRRPVLRALNAFAAQDGGVAAARFVALSGDPRYLRFLEPIGQESRPNPQSVHAPYSTNRPNRGSPNEAVPANHWHTMKDRCRGNNSVWQVRFVGSRNLLHGVDDFTGHRRFLQHVIGIVQRAA